MRRGAIDHPKMSKLARLLGVPRMQAVGMMEALWHATARHAPQGDIGRWDDESIADALEWEGDAAELIAALVKVRFLDIHDVHRLLVHDWHEHADETVKKTLRRAKLGFLSGQKTDTVRTTAESVRTTAAKVGLPPDGLGMARHGCLSEEGVGETNGEPDVVAELTSAGFSVGEAMKLAVHPNSGAAYIRRVVAASRAKAILRPKGWIKAAIENGDFELTDAAARDGPDPAFEQGVADGIARAQARKRP